MPSMRKYIQAVVMITCCIINAVWNSSCKKVAIVTTTTTDVNIYEYLVKNPDRYSELVKIVDKSGYSGFLNAYGSYTLFAPTNDAVKLYLGEISKTSVDQLTED